MFFFIAIIVVIFASIFIDFLKKEFIKKSHFNKIYTIFKKSYFDYENYLSKRSKLRQPSAIRALQPLLSIPGMISLGGGMPNQETFPFRKITCEMLDGTIIDVCDEETIDESFQYSPTQGIPRLVKQLEILQQKEHNNNSENDDESDDVTVNTDSLIIPTSSDDTIIGGTGSTDFFYDFSSNTIGGNDTLSDQGNDTDDAIVFEGIPDNHSIIVSRGTDGEDIRLETFNTQDPIPTSNANSINTINTPILFILGS